MGALIPLAIVVILILGIIKLIRFFVGKKDSSDKKNNLEIFLSKNDAFGQIYLCLSFVLLAFFVILLNMYFDSLFKLDIILISISIIALIGAYYFKALLLAVIALPVLIVSLAFKSELIKDFEIFSLIYFALSFILIYLIGRWQSVYLKWTRFANLHIAFGLIFSFVILNIITTVQNQKLFSVRYYNYEIFKPFIYNLSTTALILLAIITLSVIAIWLVNFLKSSMQKIDLVSIFADMAFLTIFTIFHISNINNFWIVFAMNVYLFFRAFSFVIIGQKVKEAWLVNFGFIVTFVLVLWKYFDYFSDFMDRSLFFLSVGIIFIVGGFIFEKKRRSMIEQIKNNNI
jgi:hypothetical protein